MKFLSRWTLVNALLFLLQDPHGSVQRIASFLGIETTPEIVQKTVEKSQFKTMKNDNTANLTWYDQYRNEGATPHMRKGIVSYDIGVVLDLRAIP